MIERMLTDIPDCFIKNKDDGFVKIQNLNFSAQYIVCNRHIMQQNFYRRTFYGFIKDSIMKIACYPE
jgi:hypothetical protein